MIPSLALRRDIYQKGLHAGQRSRDYSVTARDRALNRFLRRYNGQLDMDTTPEVKQVWLEGWMDAKAYRDA